MSEKDDYGFGVDVASGASLDAIAAASGIRRTTETDEELRARLRNFHENLGPRGTVQALAYGAEMAMHEYKPLGVSREAAVAELARYWLLEERPWKWWLRIAWLYRLVRALWKGTRR